MEAKKTIWYAVTVWDGQGNNETLIYTTSIDEAMRRRMHTTILEETIYTVSDMYLKHIPRTNIDVFSVKDGERVDANDPVLTLTWY